MIPVSSCLSLLIFNILFLSGTKNSPGQPPPVVLDANKIPESEVHVDPDRGPCTAVAAMMHFFLLATFTWSSLYAAQMLLHLKTVRSSQRGKASVIKPILIATAIGWGFPLVVVSVTLAATYRVNNPLNYRQEELNTLKELLSNLSLAVLLSLSWLLGYLIMLTNDSKAVLALSIVFCIFNTTQGLQIFILFPDWAKITTKARTVQVPSISISLHSRTYHMKAGSDIIGDTSETYRPIEMDFLSSRWSLPPAEQCNQYIKENCVFTQPSRQQEGTMTTPAANFSPTPSSTSTCRGIHPPVGGMLHSEI
ncbi:hypothetical protein JZ751_029548, partial [Albula glossodonta]